MVVKECLFFKVSLLTLGYWTVVCHTKPLNRNYYSIRSRRQLDLETADSLLEHPLFREDVSSISFDHQLSGRTSDTALQPSSIVDAVARHNIPLGENELATATEEAPLANVKNFRKDKVISPAGTEILRPDALFNGHIVTPASFSKFSTQDGSGQFVFGHVTVDQSTLNNRDALGNQLGHFSCINPEGKEVIVRYTAGSEGFRVLSNAQSQPSAGVSVASPNKAIVQEPPDVIKARQEHLALFEEARTRIKHPKILQSVRTD